LFPHCFLSSQFISIMLTMLTVISSMLFWKKLFYLNDLILANKICNIGGTIAFWSDVDYAKESVVL